jgi:hypothetical protein
MLMLLLRLLLLLLHAIERMYADLHASPHRCASVA